MKERSAALWIFLLGAALFGCALLLVSSQHQARSLFVDLERAQGEARNREVEWNRLRIELSRAGQPGYVEQSARALGLKPVDSRRTILIAAPAPEAQ